jgi:hypothetical protein
LRYLIFAPVFILLLSAPRILAAPASYQSGVEAFRAGDYHEALTHFIATRQAGNQSPALLYNIGVSYYRLTQYSQARTAFTELAAYSAWQALASYNLGLTEAKLSNPGKAREYWQQVVQLDSDPRLVALASERLAQAEAVASLRPQVFMQVQGGYDSNPDQLHHSLAVADYYTDLYLAADLPAQRWNAALFLRDYQRHDAPDWLQLSADRELWQSAAAVPVAADVRAGVRYERWDGAPYAATPFVDISSNYRKYGAELSALYSAGYEYRFGGNTDDRLQQRLRLSLESGNYYWRGWLGYQLEDTSQSGTEASFTNSGRMLRSVFSGARMSWAQGLSLRAQLEKRHALYHESLTITDLDGTEKTARRRQELWRISADLQWRTNQWRLHAGVMAGKANDRFELYDFTQHQVYAGAGYQW